MTDAYDLFVIGIVMVILREIYGTNLLAESTLATAVLVGATLGQLFFGLLGDRIGRKKMFIVTLSVITSMAIACSLAFPENESIYISLGIFRTILGFGIGGEYPLSATLAAEGATSKTRGRQMAIVFSMQGWGYLLAPLVVLFFIGVGVPLDLVWRLTLGFGALPALATAYHRLKLHESHQFKKTQGVVSQKEAWRLIWTDYKWILLGTAGTWFLFDITFYGNGLFKETVIIILGLSGSGSMSEILFRTAISSLVIAAIALPGYWLSILLIDVIGRRPIQFLGFAFIAVVFASMGLFYDQLKQIGPLFVVIYGFTFFFSNFGPNATTYIVPGEVFPTEIRATCHGISSAAGKLGAIVGTALFEPISETFGYQVTFFACAVVAFLGLLLTFLVPETKKTELKSHFGTPEEYTSIKPR